MLRADPLWNPEPLIRRVYSYVAYRIGDGADAEDVTSATFERALRYRSSYDRSKGEPVAWLLGIARRCVDDFFSERRELTTDPPDQLATGDLEIETAERLALTKAVAFLDQRDRELVALRYGADLRAREIGEVLGMSTNAVEVALHRALARLRAALGDGDSEETKAADALSSRSP